MVEEPGPGEEGADLQGGRLKKWIDRLTIFQKLLAAATATVVAVGALVTAVFGLADPIGHESGDQPTASSVIVTQDGSPTLPVTQSPTSTKQPVPVPTPSLYITVACQLSGDVHEGRQTTATYKITSNQEIKVGLGSGVYDSDGTDQSNGDGDVDAYQLVVGTQSVSHAVTLPSGLAADRYEIDAEIWPANQIGANGVETLADVPCGSFNVS